MLAFARRQPLAPEPVDAARLLMAAEDMLRRTVGEAVQLELVIGGGLWFMRADPVQFENALLNLALNARDAMTGPEGTAKGRLTIEAANASLDEAYASRSAEVSPGQYVMVAVTDTGTGMTAEQRARAIEPFYTTKPEGRGTGLGLPMVLGFAKQSGGHFVLYSEPGRGTTARLYIPRTTAPALLAEAPRSDERVVDDGQHLVLLVEDDSGVRQIARDALADLGYLVVEAESADAALALLEGGCRPRLLFTDVVMPGDVSAPALARRAKALIPGLGVLFTSGYTQNSIVHNGQLDADVALISKPWRQEDLARALRAALDGTGLRPPAPRRILLVEDEELVRMTTADALAELGFEVLEASTAAGAMGRLSPPPDLLLTDYGLPDRTGSPWPGSCGSGCRACPSCCLPASRPRRPETSSGCQSRMTSRLCARLSPPPCAADQGQVPLKPGRRPRPGAPARAPRSRSLQQHRREAAVTRHVGQDVASIREQQPRAFHQQDRLDRILGHSVEGEDAAIRQFRDEHRGWLAAIGGAACGRSVASALILSVTSNTSCPSWIRRAWTSRLMATFGCARNVL